MAEPVEKELYGTLYVVPALLQAIATCGGNFLFTTLYTENPGNTSWLFYMVAPGFALIAIFFLFLSHYYYSERLEVRGQSDEIDQALLDSDQNSESFSEFDPDATPLD